MTASTRAVAESVGRFNATAARSPTRNPVAPRIHKTSSILYAPWRHGQGKDGVDRGAQRIHRLVDELISNSRHSLSPHSHTVLTGDNDNESYHHELYKARTEWCHSNTLVVGGDHSVAIGSLLGSLAECLASQ